MKLTWHFHWRKVIRNFHQEKPNPVLTNLCQEIQSFHLRFFYQTVQSLDRTTDHYVLFSFRTSWVRIPDKRLIAVCHFLVYFQHLLLSQEVGRENKNRVQDYYTSQQTTWKERSSRRRTRDYCGHDHFLLLVRQDINVSSNLVSFFSQSFWLESLPKMTGYSKKISKKVKPSFKKGVENQRREWLIRD